MNPVQTWIRLALVLYRQLIETHASDRLVIISSNDEAEYDFCETVLMITDWKNES